MRTADIIRSAARNISRKKLRTALASAGVAIGCLAVVVIVSISQGVKAFLAAQVRGYSGPRTLIVRRKGSFSGMKMMSRGLQGFGKLPAPVEPGDRLYRTKFIDPVRTEEIRALAHVETVKPQVMVPINSVRLKGRNKRFHAFYAPWSEEEPLRLSCGRHFSSPAAREIILTPEYAAVFGARPEDLVGRTVVLEIARPINNFLKVITDITLPEPEEVELTICGFADTGIFTTLVWLPEETAAAMARTAFSFPEEMNAALTLSGIGTRPIFSMDNKVAMAKVIVDDRAHLPGVKKRLRSTGYIVVGREEMLGNLEEIFDTLAAVLSVFAFIAFGVAMLGIVNTLLMSVGERKREIGVMMALGGTRGAVRALFSAEAAIIGFLGGSGGILAGLLAGAVANIVAARTWPHIWDNYDIFVFRPWLVPAVLLGASCLSLLAGIYPAHVAAGQDPVDVLRYN